MSRPPLFFWLVLGLAVSRAEIRIAILMQGSDFINVSVVPSFDVNQFDLGDVFISPCRGGTYNEARDSYCKDCSVCTADQYQHEDCIATHNRVCLNCTVCTEREQQVCACRQLSADCVAGNRVCFPLPPTTANITFDLTVSAQLSALKERFLQEGLRTGFVLFLSEYLGHTPDDITFLSMSKLSTRVYTTTFIITNLYSLFSKSRVAELDQSVVQSGLTSTFGVQSNTFSTVSQQRRRLLQASTGAVEINAKNVVSACVIEGVDVCGRFFYVVTSDVKCSSECAPLPCPPGYTGFQGVCELCPNATYKPVEGNDTCTACPPGAVSNEGSTDAAQCWVPTTTPKYVSTSSASPGSSSGLVFIGTTPAAGGVTRVPPASSSSSTALSSTVARTTSTTRSTAAEGWVTTSSSAVQEPATTTTAATGGGSGGGPSTGWGSWINLTVINNYFNVNPAAGRAETIQYVITVNNGASNQWAVPMVWALMSVGLVAIGAIGTRVFCLVGTQREATYTRIPSAPPGGGKKEIPLPIRLPSPPDPHAHHSSDDDEPQPSGKRGDVFHFQMPKGGFLEQRRLSRGLDDGDY